MKDLLRVLMTPSCWIQNDSYNKCWNTMLLRLALQHKFKRINIFEAELGGTIVWISNHPYASFTPTTDIKCRPSRRTILKLYDKLIVDTLIVDTL